MKDVSFDDCVEFQDCFLFNGHFSPFENVKDFRSYYPLVLLGEVGGLLNLSCKLVRSANIYTEEIKDECADTFIYLLMFGRMLEMHEEITERKAVLRLIKERWNQPVAPLQTETDYYNEFRKIMKNIDSFLGPEKENLYNEKHFYEIFLSIQRITTFITGLEWQQVINDFHKQVILKHTDPKEYTAGGRYRGAFLIRIDKLLDFVYKIGLGLPRRRIECLERLASIEHPEPMVSIETRFRPHPVRQDIAKIVGA